MINAYHNRGQKPTCSKAAASKWPPLSYAKKVDFNYKSRYERRIQALFYDGKSEYHTGKND